MTPAQLTTLKAAILAETDPAFAELRQVGAVGAMADFYNADASPSYYAWRSTYSPDMIRDAITNGITQLDALTGSKRDSLLWWAQGTHDARRPAVQSAINDLCGSQNVLKSAVTDGAKRLALRGERLFATGIGTLASPGVLVYEGQVSNDDVIQAINLP